MEGRREGRRDFFFIRASLSLRLILFIVCTRLTLQTSACLIKMTHLPPSLPSLPSPPPSLPRATTLQFTTRSRTLTPRTTDVSKCVCRPWREGRRWRC